MTVTIQEFKGGQLLEVPELSWHTFSDGCPHINGRIDGLWRQFVVTVRGGSPELLVKAMLALDVLKRHGAWRVALFAPYAPGARQDKAPLMTAELSGHLMSGFDRVILVDPHSDVIVSAIQPKVLTIKAVDVFPRVDSKDSCVIAPDAGATLRAGEVANRLGVPLVVAHKKRDPGNNFRICEYELPTLPAPRAIVVDDICDGGGTFLALAKASGLGRKNLTLWTTHAIYSRGMADLEDAYDRIMCSDSLMSSCRAHVVVPLEPFLLKKLKENLENERRIPDRRVQD